VDLRIGSGNEDFPRAFVRFIRDRGCRLGKSGSTFVVGPGASTYIRRCTNLVGEDLMTAVQLTVNEVVASAEERAAVVMLVESGELPLERLPG